jgi:hypothetical protein
MTKFPYDEFAKGFLGSLLSPIGNVQTSFKISSEVREVDIYFQPNEPSLNVSELGLLAQLAKQSIILEPFRSKVKAHQVRFCLGKTVDLHAQIFREIKRIENREPQDNEYPFLWILTPTISTTILELYRATIAAEIGMAGVYTMGDGLKAGIVAIHQLPKNPATLWFRLLGRDRVLSEAIEEVTNLPPESLFRQDALSWLGNLRVILEAKESRDPQEDELMMQLSPLFLEKLAAAERIGFAKGEARMVVRLLNRRLGEVPPPCLTEIQQLGIDRLEDLAEALHDFSTLADLEKWLAKINVKKSQ